MLVTGFLFGGLVTAAEVLANAMLYLCSHRDVRATLAGAPERMPNFVQDMVRWVSPAPAVARTVTGEMAFAGEVFRPGDRVLALIGAANMDERCFDDPQSVTTSEWRSRHLGFGLGTHFCPGAPLARLEIELALRELLRRMPDFEIAGLHQFTAGLAAPEGGWLPMILHPNIAG